MVASAAEKPESPISADDQKHSFQSSKTTGSAAIHSSLPVEDEVLRQLVEEFVGELPHRIAAMSEAFQSKQYDQLAGLAHSLKGSGGTAGYGCLTEPSAQVEQLAKAGKAYGIDQAIEQLEQLQHRILV
jgi:HPt (histidine-containing phosphotransfer) domain-containing protein